MKPLIRQTLKARLTGTAPYMMHNVRLANPLDPFTKELKRLTSKRNKTDDDHEQIAHAEYLGGLYWNERVHVYLPARQLEACILIAARSKKLGKQTARGLWILQDELPLEYKGPTDVEDLFTDKQFVDLRNVKISGRSVMRCRPIFRDWALTVELVFDETVLNRQDVEEILSIAGAAIGVGELRPRYGRFDIQVML